MIHDSNSIIQNIINLENLHWAWEKAKNFYNKDEYWIDQLELAKFTANYEGELKNIIVQIKNGKYKLNPIKPIFFPKYNADTETAENRQMFWVSVRDQVVWLAIVNV
ncbi:MAG: hypothetical protein ABSG15_15385, partial [FCB group bacterium]